MRRPKKQFKYKSKPLHWLQFLFMQIIKPFYLEANASDFALDLVHSQYGDHGHLHPIALRSKNFFAAKINYKIYNKELLPIIDVFEEWCHSLGRTQHTFTGYMDHKNLKYFMSAHVLNYCQARWSTSLSCFDLVLI